MRLFFPLLLLLLTFVVAAANHSPASDHSSLQCKGSPQQVSQAVIKALHGHLQLDSVVQEQKGALLIHAQDQEGRQSTIAIEADSHNHSRIAVFSSEAESSQQTQRLLASVL